MTATMALPKECSATNIAVWRKTSRICFTSKIEISQVETFPKACIESTDLRQEASSALQWKLRAGSTIWLAVGNRHLHSTPKWRQRTKHEVCTTWRQISQVESGPVPWLPTSNHRPVVWEEAFSSVKLIGSQTTSTSLTHLQRSKALASQASSLTWCATLLCKRVWLRNKIGAIWTRSIKTCRMCAPPSNQKLPIWASASLRSTSLVKASLASLLTKIRKSGSKSWIESSSLGRLTFRRRT